MGTTALKLSKEFTVALIKSDIYKVPSHTAIIKSILQANNLEIIREKPFQFTEETARQFYGEHKGLFFYSRLVSHMQGLPVGAYIVYGEDAIKRWRSLLGLTKVYLTVTQQPLSLRGIFGLTDTRNGFHGSDSRESALKEAKFFFPDFNVNELPS